MKDKIICAASYFWVLFFLPLILIPSSSFGRFHANQALINLLFSVLATVAMWIVGWIPIIGIIVVWLLRLVVFAMLLWGVFNALLGGKKPYPFIGGLQFIK